MRRFVLLLFSALLSVLSYSQISMNAVKAFDFSVDSDSVYNFYIDSIGTPGEVVFCFQTVSGKLVKTDFDGKVLSTTANPYTYFTIWDGDTLILKGYDIINSKGDTIVAGVYRGRQSDIKCRFIAAASEHNIYVYTGRDVGVVTHDFGYINRVVNVLEEGNSRSIFTAKPPLSGLCVYNNKIYGIRSEPYTIGGHDYLIWRDVSLKESGQQDVLFEFTDPVGLAGYGGYLYVYSSAEKAIFRLEKVDETAVYPVKEGSPEEPVHYGLDGRIVDQSTTGIHVVKYPAGSVEKTIVK